MAITRLVVRWDNGTWISTLDSEFNTHLAELTGRLGAPDDIVHCDPSKDCPAWSGNTEYAKQAIHLDLDR